MKTKAWKQRSMETKEMKHSAREARRSSDRYPASGRVSADFLPQGIGQCYHGIRPEQTPDFCTVSDSDYRRFPAQRAFQQCDGSRPAGDPADTTMGLGRLFSC